MVRVIIKEGLLDGGSWQRRLAGSAKTWSKLGFTADPGEGKRDPWEPHLIWTSLKVGPKDPEILVPPFQQGKSRKFVEALPKCNPVQQLS